MWPDALTPTLNALTWVHECEREWRALHIATHTVDLYIMNRILKCVQSARYYYIFAKRIHILFFLFSCFHAREQSCSHHQPRPFCFRANRQTFECEWLATGCKNKPQTVNSCHKKLEALCFCMAQPQLPGTENFLTVRQQIQFYGRRAIKTDSKQCQKSIKPAAIGWYSMRCEWSLFSNTRIWWKIFLFLISSRIKMFCVLEQIQ